MASSGEHARGDEGGDEDAREAFARDEARGREDARVARPGRSRGAPAVDGAARAPAEKIGAIESGR